MPFSPCAEGQAGSRPSVGSALLPSPAGRAVLGTLSCRSAHNHGGPEGPDGLLPTPQDQKTVTPGPKGCLCEAGLPSQPLCCWGGGLLRPLRGSAGLSFLLGRALPEARD